MTDRIVIDPASYDAAAAGIRDTLQDLQGGYDNFTAVLGNLGNFLGNDDAGRQLKGQYNPAESDLRSCMARLLEDLPILARNLHADAASWRNADTTRFGD